MNKLVSLATAGAVLAIGLAAAASANAAAHEVKRAETAANLAMLKADLGAVANVTFSSDLPGAEQEADSLTAFGMVVTGETGDISQPNFDVSSARLVDIVFYSDTKKVYNNRFLSDDVGRFVDKNGREMFSFDSPDVETAVPEPATWAMMLTGLAFAGVALRRRQKAAALAHA